MNFADSYYKKSLIQKLMTRKELLIAYCAATNMPLVECNQETFNDQVFLFETEEILKSFAKPYFEKKMPLKGVKFTSADRMKLFSMLISVNVDELIYIDSFGRHFVKISDFVKKKDFSDLPKEKRPIENPQLQLSGIYFMQEASRNLSAEEKEQQKETLQELEEEFAANLVKGTYILPFALQENAQDAAVPEGVQLPPDAKQLQLPLIKTPQGDTFLPIFTDNLEFEKYNKEHKLKAMAVPFANLSKMMVKESKGYMINPNGFHVVLTQPMVLGLMKRFGIEPVVVTPEKK